MGHILKYAAHIEFGYTHRSALLLFVQQQVGDEETADDEKERDAVSHDRQLEAFDTPVAEVFLERMSPHDRQRCDGTQSIEPR